MPGDAGSTQPHHPHVCPPSVIKFLNSPLRALLENPRRLMKDFVRPGDTAVDLGCGGGIFSVALARLVGSGGRVIAVDLQTEMLEITRRLARKHGVLDRIALHRCAAGDFDLGDTRADFVLAAHVVHEAPQSARFLEQAAGLLRPGAYLLLLEPKFHVGRRAFAATMHCAEGLGLLAIRPAGSLFSRGMVLQRRSA